MHAPIDTAISATAPHDAIFTEIEGGVTAPIGFRAAGVHCGVRKKRLDLAVIAADAPASVAGVFTLNKLAAAPVILCRELLAKTGGKGQAIVVNSGNANACTGPKGMADAATMVTATARAMGIAADAVLVASTGVIGQPLPIANIEAGIPEAIAALATDGSNSAAEAILTTDTKMKSVAVEVACGAGAFRVGGIAKGSGMIHPSMATTLAFVTTDAPIAPAALQATLSAATDATFNQITVDGDTSTNDAIIALALGKANLSAADFAPGTPGGAAFQAAFTHVLETLAKMVAGDGEGATRLISVEITGAASVADARKAAKAIAQSPLVKTAIHGADANWGRIACAVGYSGAEVIPEKMTVKLAGLTVLSPGFVCAFDEAEATRRLKEPEVRIAVDLDIGEATARAWGCDLSAEYVRINGDYRS